MEKMVLISLVLLHYLSILYVHLQSGRTKIEKQRTRKKLLAIWFKDWLLTPIMILSVLAYLFYGQTAFWQAVSVPVNGTLKLLGGIVVVAGFALKFHAYRSLGRNWSAKSNIYSDHALVMAGPYRFLRHPVYVSYLLTFAGFGILSGNLLFLCYAIVYHALNSIRAKHEERALLVKFGRSYRAYLASTEMYRGACVMMLILASTVIGGIDEVVYLPLTGRSFTLEWGYWLWLQLAG